MLKDGCDKLIIDEFMVEWGYAVPKDETEIEADEPMENLSPVKTMELDAEQKEKGVGEV